MRRYLAPLLLAAAALGVAANAAELRPFTASYLVSWHGMNAGTSSFKLQQETGGEWTYTSRNQPQGVFRLIPAAAATLRSRMSVGPDGVRPLLFTAAANDAEKLEGEVHFDWSANRATGQMQGAKVDMELRPGVQDDLSVQVALIHALANDNVPTDIAIFDQKGIRDYAYTRVGTETLSTPVGEIATVIYRSQRSGSPRSTRFWCAPEFGFVPMRAEQQRAGRVEWTMNLQSIHRD